MTDTRPPTGLQAPGRRLWASVVDRYELDEHERALLVEAVRTVDLLDKIDRELRREGPKIETPHGLRAHPAGVEARQQRIALARLISALRLPDDGDAAQPAAGRPQRRAGVRGVYRIGGST